MGIMGRVPCRRIGYEVKWEILDYTYDPPLGGTTMTTQRKKYWIFLCLAILMLGFALTCTGCMSEETRDENGTTKKYHQPMLGPQLLRLFFGMHLGNADPNRPAR